MNEDRKDGMMNQATGAVKQAAGKITGNDKLESEGTAQRSAGKVQDAAGKISDKIDGMVDGVKKAVNK